MSAAEPNFDRIARLYRYLEYLTLGRALERCRNHFLPHLLVRRQALVLGDGDGRFLAGLLTVNPELCATAVDTSATMLKLLRRRCESVAPRAGTRLRSFHASALQHQPAPDTDLIVAHFFFDCLTQPDLDRLIGCIAGQVRPGAIWLISEFHIPNGRLRMPARLLIRTLYLAFRVLTGLRTTRIPDYAKPLAEAGLTRLSQHDMLGGILTTELWQSSKTK